MMFFLSVFGLVFSCLLCCVVFCFFFFFFNDTATTEIYTLSLHDALPIFPEVPVGDGLAVRAEPAATLPSLVPAMGAWRSEEHTSELQSRLHLVCRLLLEKKKRHRQHHHNL